MARILLLGEGDLTEETAEALRAADAEVRRLKDPTHEELKEALDAGADAAMVVLRDDGDRPVGLRCSDGAVEVASLPEVRGRRARALVSAILKPFDRSAALVFFGAVGLLAVLVLETVGASLVLDQ